MKRIALYSVIIAALLLGGGLGALWSLQAGQARHWLGARAPDWLALPDPQSRIEQGQISDTNGLFEPNFRINWSDFRLSSAGPSWAVRAVRPGAEITGRALVDPKQGVFTLTRGDLALANLLPAASEISGDVTLLSGQAAFDWTSRHIQSGTGRGLMQRLTWAGFGLGDFDMALVIRPLQWQAVLTSLPENPLSAQLTLSALAGQTTITLDAVIQDSPDLDPGLRRILSRVAPLKDGGWQIQQAIPIRQITAPEVPP